MGALTQLDSGMVNATMTRVLVYCVMLISVVYDLIAFARGWKTITSVLRDVDYQTGTLLRWAFVAIWLHLFVTWGSNGYGK